MPPDTPTNQLEDHEEGTATSLRYVGSICRSISSFMPDDTNSFVPSSVVAALTCICPHRHNAIINIAFLNINFNLSIILSINAFCSCCLSVSSSCLPSQGNGAPNACHLRHRCVPISCHCCHRLRHLALRQMS